MKMISDVAAACGLAVALAACATTANTSQQNLAYDRWEKCRTPYTQLQQVDLDGRIAFQFSNSADRDDVLRCLADASRSGPPLPVPRTAQPPGGP